MHTGWFTNRTPGEFITWWAVRPRKKIFGFPPQVPTGTLPAPPCGRAKWYHLSFWRFFPCFIAIFGPIEGQSMWRGQLWCCDVFPNFKGISGGLGVLEPRIHHLSFSGPKMAFSSSQTLRFTRKMANFEATNTVKQGK